jgi:hypothetical protein
MAVDAVDTYTLICENWVEAIQAGQDYHFELPVSERCDVSAGDVVGWGHEGQGDHWYHSFTTGTTALFLAPDFSRRL